MQSATATLKNDHPAPCTQARRLLLGVAVTTCLLVLAVALCLPKLNLSARMQKWSAYGFIYVAWSFTVFYWLGNASSNRALTMGESALGEPDLIGLIGFLPGLPSVFIVVFLLFIAAKGVFGRP